MRYIPIIAIFSTQLFFVIAALLSYEYGGSESSPMYILVNLIIFSLSMSVFFFDAVLKKAKFGKSQFVILLVPLIVTSLYLYSIVVSNIDTLGSTRFLYFILWSIPALYMGIYLSKKSRIEDLTKFLDVIMLLFSMAILTAIPKSLALEGRLSIAGSSSLGTSYIAAIAFGINLYYLYYGDNYERYHFAKHKFFKVACNLLLLIQILGVLFSGGRGGLVLMFVYFIYVNSRLVFDKKPVRMMKYIVSLISVIILLNPLLSYFLDIPSFEESFNRAFAFISSGGIDFSESSGRDILYSNAIRMIHDSPLYGYGIFGMWRAVGYYPHNFFLEVLLQGGIIYMLFWCIIFFFIFRKYIKMIRLEPRLEVIGVLGLYPLVMLMFSGTYIHNSMFWFCLAFICSFKADNEKSKN